MYYRVCGYCLVLLLIIEMVCYAYAVECLGTQTLTDSSGVATSQGFPSEYKLQTNCAFHIEAPKGQSIFLVFETFDLNPNCSDNVRIFDSDRDDILHLYHIYCGSNSPSEIISSKNHLYITFTTDRQYGNGRQGFKFNWIFIDEVSGCYRLKVQGFTFNTFINGNYTRTIGGCSGRPIYEQEGAPYMKMFYEESAWYISDPPRQCSGDPVEKAYAVARDGASLPELVVANWEEKDDNGVWYQQRLPGIECINYSEDAGPKGLSKGALSGIIAASIAGLFLLPVAVLLIAGAIKNKCKKAPNIETGQAVHQQDITTRNHLQNTTFDPQLFQSLELNVPNQQDQGMDLPPAYDDVVSFDGQNNFHPVIANADSPPPYKGKIDGLDHHQQGNNNNNNNDLNDIHPHGDVLEGAS